ncbi:hypothetical protein D9611_005144 [Ephemerocybe angulata]|uniref:Uncharacterized protein n=1 Tax=Ephemerocybe angulata TaxID=980116 RepID=A0A8H5C0Z4_9AGAR|nr:hypothetical protein D9611_005144 [Tulosesus angulatus]
MTNAEQALSDDILGLILQQYLVPWTGYTPSSRLQTIKSVSLSCRALALICRKFIFEYIVIAIGGTETSKNNAEDVASLLESNPSYLNFIRGLRVKSHVRCVPSSGVSAPLTMDNKMEYPSSSDIGTVALRYTSSMQEEAAVCWILAQKFLQLQSFHLSILPERRDHLQFEILSEVCRDTSLLRCPQWSSQTDSSPAAEGVATLIFQEAILHFLGTGDFEHLSLTSNLPTRLIKFCNTTKLKSLTLCNFTHTPMVRKQSELPFLFGREDSATPCESLSVEDLTFDDAPGDVYGWVKGPDCHLDLKDLKTLTVYFGDDPRSRVFPIKAMEKLTCLRIFQKGSIRMELRPLKNLRQFTYATDCRLNRPPMWLTFTLSRVLLRLPTVPNHEFLPLEYLEVMLRVQDVDSPATIEPLAVFSQWLCETKALFKNLRTLRIVVCLSDSRWHESALEARERWGDILRSPFLETISSLDNTALDTAVVKRSDYPLWNARLEANF